MTTTDRHEAPLVELAVLHENPSAFIAEQLGLIAINQTRAAEIHQLISGLNRELVDLQNQTWGYQCDIERAKNGQ